MFNDLKKEEISSLFNTANDYVQELIDNCHLVHLEPGGDGEKVFSNTRMHLVLIFMLAIYEQFLIDDGHPKILVGLSRALGEKFVEDVFKEIVAFKNKKDQEDA